MYTGYTQKNGVVSLYSPLKPHHSFVYTLYVYVCMYVCMYFKVSVKPFKAHWSLHAPLDLTLNNS
jgi:hypothetical protein